MAEEKINAAPEQEQDVNELRQIRVDKLNAMRAHATQISLESGFFALSNNIGSPTWSTEYFRLVRGQAAGPFDAEGRESDLFAGV